MLYHDDCIVQLRLMLTQRFVFRSYLIFFLNSKGSLTFYQYSVFTYFQGP